MPGGSDAPLAGRRVVVTRPAEDAAELMYLLRAAGADVVEAPTIRIELAAAAVGDAWRAHRYDWVVVTSVNGVRALAAAGIGRTEPGAMSVRVAVVGPATAAAARAAGLPVDLEPAAALGAALVDAFARVSAGGGRVLVAQADRAGPAVAAGLRDRGWTVDAVTAYRTVAVGRDGDVAERLAGADAVTFLSGSAARSFVEAYGVGAVPPVVACIGPSTATVCRQLDLPTPSVADPHTVPALVRVLVAALDPGRTGG